MTETAKDWTKVTLPNGDGQGAVESFIRVFICCLIFRATVPRSVARVPNLFLLRGAMVHGERWKKTEHGDGFTANISAWQKDVEHKRSKWMTNET